MLKLNKQNKKKKIVLLTTITASLVVIGLSVGLVFGLQRKSPIKYIFGKSEQYHTIEELDGKDLKGYILYINIDTKSAWSSLPLFNPDDQNNLNLSYLITPTEDYMEFSSLDIYNAEINDGGETDSTITFTHIDNNGIVIKQFSLLNLTWLPSALDSITPTWRTLSLKKNFVRIQLTGFWKNISTSVFDNDLLNSADNIYLSK